LGNTVDLIFRRRGQLDVKLQTLNEILQRHRLAAELFPLNIFTVIAFVFDLLQSMRASQWPDTIQE
jgi:hypothetical protein